MEKKQRQYHINGEGSGVWPFGPNIQKMCEKQDVKGLTRVLVHKDYLFRIRAVEALGGIGSPQALEALASHREEEPAVKRTIIKVMAGLGGETAVATLQVMLQDPDLKVRLTVVRSLRDMQEEDAVGLLTLALANYQVRVRIEAVDALVQLGGTRIIEPLLSALRDPDEDVCVKAFDALMPLCNSLYLEAFAAAFTVPAEIYFDEMECLASLIEKSKKWYRRTDKSLGRYRRPDPHKEDQWPKLMWSLFDDNSVKIFGGEDPWLKSLPSLPDNLMTDLELIWDAPEFIKALRHPREAESRWLVNALGFKEMPENKKVYADQWNAVYELTNPGSILLAGIVRDLVDEVKGKNQADGDRWQAIMDLWQFRKQICQQRKKSRRTVFELQLQEPPPPKMEVSGGNLIPMDEWLRRSRF